MSNPPVARELSAPKCWRLRCVPLGYRPGQRVTRVTNGTPSPTVVGNPRVRFKPGSSCPGSELLDWVSGWRRAGGFSANSLRPTARRRAAPGAGSSFLSRSTLQVICAPWFSGMGWATGAGSEGRGPPRASPRSVGGSERGAAVRRSGRGARRRRTQGEGRSGWRYEDDGRGRYRRGGISRVALGRRSDGARLLPLLLPTLAR